MRISTRTAVGLVALSILACSKKEPPAGTAASASAAIEAPKPSAEPVPSAVTAPSASVAPTTTATEISATAPGSFAGAEPIKHAVATGLGCEARSKEGWLELLCRKKNGAGGHPKLAVLGTGEEAPQVEPDDKGELRVVVPYHDGAETLGTIEWTDTKYNLTVRGTELKLDWAVSMDVNRSCAKLDKEKTSVINAATKSTDPEHLTAAEAAKFPRFGVCQPAGLGSWALGLRGVSAAGAGDARSITFELDVVRVGPDGKVTKADFGKVQAKPGGFEIRPLQIYDYDDDGKVELIVPHELKAVPPGTKPDPLFAVWTEQNDQVAPFKNFGRVTGGVQTTHLDHDMRPDIGSYEPFITYLGPDCGLASCPSRIVGPLRYARSLSSGEFSRADPQAQAAITRSCPKGAMLVVDGNPAKTAQNVACARLRGEEPAKLEADLKAKASFVCKGAESCPLLDALLGFAYTNVSD